MSIDHSTVQDWLDRYIKAWKSYKRADITALFTDDCEYRYHPYDDEPTIGAEALADSWTEPDRVDEPASWRADYKVFAVDGNKAVAVGTSDYLDAAGELDRRYHNAFIMEFANDGRCSAFTEFYMKAPLGEEAS